MASVAPGGRCKSGMDGGTETTTQVPFEFQHDVPRVLAAEAIEIGIPRLDIGFPFCGELPGCDVNDEFAAWWRRHQGGRSDPF